jgi:hypothetical protein
MQITSTSRVVACVTILLGNLPLSAQILDYNYTFQSTDTWTELTGDQVVFSGAFDDEVSAAIPLLPTTMGVEPHTSLFISTNGFMTLSAAPSTSNYDPLSQENGFIGSTTGSNCGVPGQFVFQFNTISKYPTTSD